MLKGSRLSSLSSSLVTSTTVQAHYLESVVTTNFWLVIKRARDTGTITQYTAKIEEDD